MFFFFLFPSSSPSAQSPSFTFFFFTPLHVVDVLFRNTKPSSNWSASRYFLRAPPEPSLLHKQATLRTCLDSSLKQIRTEDEVLRNSAVSSIPCHPVAQTPLITPPSRVFTSRFSFRIENFSILSQSLPPPLLVSFIWFQGKGGPGGRTTSDMLLPCLLLLCTLA